MRFLLLLLVSFSDTNAPIVIAHRGASGYAIEHTEAAKTLAHAQDADFIEQDVVLSKDNQFIVTHDITMDETTNVAELFPTRARSDARFYFADFDWTEIQKLTVHERSSRNTSAPAIPDRFPYIAGQHVMKLVDEIQLINGLNKTLGKKTGLYIELKAPAFHKKEFGYSMGEALMTLLAKLGIEESLCPCYIQCFESEELLDLSKRVQCKLPLIQLLGKRPMDAELIRIAGYAKGIGPAVDLLASRNENNQIVSTGLVELARKSGLLVHPYTVRKHEQPKWSSSMDETHRVLIEQLKVDGFFTDFPDIGRKAVDAR